MKKIALGRKTKVVTQKTVTKKTEEFEELTIRRIEANNEGVFVGVDELPGEVFKVMDELPAELMTAIQNKLVEEVEDPTERAKRLKG